MEITQAVSNIQTNCGAQFLNSYHAHDTVSVKCCQSITLKLGKFGEDVETWQFETAKSVGLYPIQ